MICIYRPTNMDIMSRSERMLRAHMKNSAQEKNLKETITSFNQNCRRRTNRVQQQILEIYHDELQPLQEAKLASQRNNLLRVQRHGLLVKSPYKLHNSKEVFLPEITVSAPIVQKHVTPLSVQTDGRRNSDRQTTKFRLPKVPSRSNYSTTIYVDEYECPDPDVIREQWLQYLAKCARKNQKEDERLSIIGRALDIC